MAKSSFNRRGRVQRLAGVAAAAVVLGSQTGGENRVVDVEASQTGSKKLALKMQPAPATTAQRAAGRWLAATARGVGAAAGAVGSVGRKAFGWADETLLPVFTAATEIDANVKNMDFEETEWAKYVRDHLWSTSKDITTEHKTYTPIGGSEWKFCCFTPGQRYDETRHTEIYNPERIWHWLCGGPNWENWRVYGNHECIDPAYPKATVERTSVTSDAIGVRSRIKSKKRLDKHQRVKNKKKYDTLKSIQKKGGSWLSGNRITHGLEASIGQSVRNWRQHNLSKDLLNLNQEFLKAVARKARAALNLFWAGLGFVLLTAALTWVATAFTGFFLALFAIWHTFITLVGGPILGALGTAGFAWLGNQIRIANGSEVEGVRRKMDAVREKLNGVISDTARCTIRSAIYDNTSFKKLMFCGENRERAFIDALLENESEPAPGVPVGAIVPTVHGVHTARPEMTGRQNLIRLAKLLKEGDELKKMEQEKDKLTGSYRELAEDAYTKRDWNTLNKLVAHFEQAKESAHWNVKSEINEEGGLEGLINAALSGSGSEGARAMGTPIVVGTPVQGHELKVREHIKAAASVIKTGRQEPSDEFTGRAGGLMAATDA